MNHTVEVKQSETLVAIKRLKRRFGDNFTPNLREIEQEIEKIKNWPKQNEKK